MNGFTTFEHNRSDMKWPFSRIQRKAFEITILRSLIFQVDLSPISDSITQKVCTGGEHTYTYVYITCIYIYIWIVCTGWKSCPGPFIHTYTRSIYACLIPLLKLYNWSWIFCVSSMHQSSCDQPVFHPRVTALPGFSLEKCEVRFGDVPAVTMAWRPRGLVQNGAVFAWGYWIWFKDHALTILRIWPKNVTWRGSPPWFPKAFTKG